MKKVYLTADFTTTITREIEVDDDFNPNSTDINELFYQDRKFGALSNEEIECAIENLQIDEVWLVRDENDNEIYVK